jgi:anti-sigma B factor antagonist
MTASDHLRIHTDPASGAVVLGGELTFTTVSTLDAELRRRAEGDLPLVLDVAALTFCDSAGLALLIGAIRRAERQGGGVSLIGVSPSMRRLLRLTGVEQLFAFPGAERADEAGSLEERGEPA